MTKSRRYRLTSAIEGLRQPATAAAGGAILVLRYIFTAVCNYGLGVLLAWFLTAEEFGRVSVLQTVITLSSFILSAALPPVLARRIAQAGLERPGGSVATFRSALVGNALIGVALLVGLLVAQGVAGAPLPNAGPVVLGLVACTIPLIAINMVFLGAFQGSRLFGGMGFVQSADTAIRFGVGVTLGGVLGLGMPGVALAYLLGSLTAAAGGFVILARRLPGRGPLAPFATFRPSIPIGLGTIALGVVMTVDLLMLSALGPGGNAAVAEYQVASIFARAIFFVGIALSSVVFPYIAQHGPGHDSHAWFLAAARWIPLSLIPIQLALLVAPEPILAIAFPARYGDASSLVRILAVGTVGLLLAEMLLQALVALGAPRVVAVRVTLAAVTEVAFLVLLVPTAGATGAAVAFGIGTWVATGLLAHAYLRLQPRKGFTLSGPLRQALALGAMLPALLTARLVPPFAGALAIGVGFLVYLIVARLLRVITDADVLRARQALGALVPRKRP
ncbi:oligosaccharide flippase family protein [Arthrobacter sp. MSA 4-2]|uniref:oligosaccharide flippase family protein n=1 Tax=Arthrobacter sp. MSA 4-2 TaxID=2794349 RepID=UPI0018E85078|nr:oligosaccharide flippase family protein [Arthrobacter sp. MSA 4-2]MBJ2120379.1 oligosaccharide flippase family protein [Arthrobacter sp. MSA 4-2]